MIPAKVVAFDRTNNTVDVQPQIMFVDIRNKTISRQPLVRLAAMSMGGGGFHISFPLKAGDLGWIWAADRDLTLFKANLAESAPPTARLHKFADGLFIPDVFRQYTIQSEDASAMVIQSTSGATRISIRGDNIKITAPSNVTVDTPTANFTHDVNIAGNLSVTQNTTVTGATAVNGGFTAAGGKACTLPATTTVNNKLVDTHTHGGVQTGGSNTNPF